MLLRFVSRPLMGLLIDCHVLGFCAVLCLILWCVVSYSVVVVVRQWQKLWLSDEGQITLTACCYLQSTCPIV